MPLPHRPVAGHHDGASRAIKIVPRKHAADAPQKQDIKPAAPLRQPVMHKRPPSTGTHQSVKPVHHPVRHKVEAPVPAAIGTATFFGTRYKLLERLNKGGTGTVYKAEDSMLDLVVAIKFLPERLTRDRATLARFKHEAGIALQLSHENIVKLHNLEIDRNRVFLVMEYVDGQDFRKIINDHKILPPTPVLQIVKACARALDYAHSRGVIHMDLKPENLMLTAESTLKIIDFGTARRIDSTQDSGRKIVEGSPPYMSPEQIQGQPLDVRADVYSLGSIVYEMLSGTTPVPFGSDLKTILATQPTPIDSLPAVVSGVICKALEKDRDRRWQSAGEFYRELLHAAEESGLTTKKTGEKPDSP